MPETSNSTYRLKFLADPAFVAEVRAAAAAEPDVISIESEKQEKGGTRLGFSFENVMAVIAAIKGAADLADVAKKIHEWFTRSKSNVVVVQTPFRTFEMRSSSKLTEEDVRKFLQAATRLSQ